ncbi:SIS domain-containing protein [Commensalibacter papalotli (ex Botero et al. 2024)]|uniref:D-arabinose 5-phosphate isomerase GutQ (GutQ) (PDB:5UQI) n=1 Tax=Commensalibacter papalotli (ex Botero et al. 2024) TaxID=2972766 RepID=A0ABM9HJ82_9PROT|nr:KpsF/GutQ family sugar-phosphate isomerase [Commensalibacter papalotli (ex Botero et al. 2024)]CAI3925280.1 D-arabinose 5-phosphate isomerase GutQ (GutQ) (PDB:5UQI) [Commensalibacter papalotli (ex Botero et al. 2024)]CAI3926781.1 D-arabinose 5-phosphate isomerase GutQ (GutQ) (PDB:5UQI) [Commensalibacter papalotli (ex Botero et al. 2024)]
MEPMSVCDIQNACDALLIEKQGIQELIDALQNNHVLSEAFDQTVQTLFTLKGRVILTGIGKSGHIAKKIQATLASTGTASFFVHPAEAAHGDLGMIQPSDVVIAISASGESAELTNIISHTKRFDIFLIAMTTNEQSTLAKAANIAMTLPKSKEACPFGLAPTTSTIMQLALGDALAITLLKKRHFTASDFGIYHPGGRLGSKLKAVRDLMHTHQEIPLGTPNMPILEAIMEMTKKALGCIGIISEQGILIGLITDGDLRRTLDKDIRNLTAQDVMNKSPMTVHEDILAAEALRLMNSKKHPITCLFVIDQNHKPTGVLHIHDLLRAGIA